MPLASSIPFFIVTLVAIGASALFVLRWARHSPQVLLLMMLLVYEMVSINASVWFLDRNRIFMRETSTFSGESNAAERLLLFNLLIIAGVAIGFRAWRALSGPPGRSVTPPTGHQCRRALWLMVFILTIAFANVLLSPGVPYPGSGFQRHSFWAHGIRFPIVRDLFGVLLIYVPFVGAAVVVYGRRLCLRRLVAFAKSVLALYFLYLLISGQVFHGLIFPVTIIIALLLVEKMDSGTRPVPGIRSMLILLGVAFAFTVTTYLSFRNRGITQSLGGAWQAVIYRVVAMQGSIYWQSDFLWRHHGPIGPPGALLDGREFLIQSILPPTLAAEYMRDGVNLQSALPGTALLSAGFWPTVMVCLAYGLVLGLITSLTYAMFANGRLYLLIPGAYLWMWTESVYGRASFDQIFSAKFLLFLAIVGVLYFLWTPGGALFNLFSKLRDNEDQSAVSQFPIPRWLSNTLTHTKRRQTRGGTRRGS